MAAARCSHRDVRPSSDGLRLVCKECGSIRGDADLQVSFESMVRSHKLQKYKRITRFREVVRCVLGDSGAYLPTFVLEFVREEMRRRSMRTASHAFVRAVIRQRPWSGRYVEQSQRIAQIVSSSSSSSLPYFGEHLKKLEALFVKVEGVYDVVVSEVCAELGWQRKTFFNYAFLLGLLLDKLELREASQVALERFSIKTPELRKRQEFLWKRVCAKLNWHTDFETNCLLNLTHVVEPRTLHLKFGGGAYGHKRLASSLSLESKSEARDPHVEAEKKDGGGVGGEGGFGDGEQEKDSSIRKKKIIRKKRKRRRKLEVDQEAAKK